MTRKLSIATALLAATAISTPLLAQAQSLPQDAVNLSNTKLSLPEAVAIAERHHAGSRMRGSYTQALSAPARSLESSASHAPVRRNFCIST